MSENLFLLTLGLPLATILGVFGMRYFSAMQQARARVADEQAYRQIAAHAAAAQAETAVALAAISATLANVQARLTAVEKVLKDVE